MPHAIVLVGQRCAGKTLLGRELASLLGGDFRDLDELAGRRFGAGGAREAWLALGEAGFRALEAEVLGAELAERARGGSVATPCRVLATGGGLADNPAALAALRAAAPSAAARPDGADGGGAAPRNRSGSGQTSLRLLVLRAPLELLLQRWRERGFPPSLGPDPADEAIRALFERREAAYAALAGLAGATVLDLAACPGAAGPEGFPSPRELALRAAALLGLDPGLPGEFR